VVGPVPEVAALEVLALLELEPAAPVEPLPPDPLVPVVVPVVYAGGVDVAGSEQPTTITVAALARKQETWVRIFEFLLERRLAPHCFKRLNGWYTFIK
jgi:hypothetical protein